MRAQLLQVLAGVFAVLLFASAVSRVLQARGSVRVDARLLSNLAERIRSWWVIAALLSIALLMGRPAVTGLFALASALALREFVAHAPPPARDARMDAACYALVALQYVVVLLGNPVLVSLALPIAAAIALPLVAVSSGNRVNLRARLAHRAQALAIAGWGLSFVPALLLPELSAYPSGDLLLVLYLIIVTQGSDVLQYVFGKVFGRRPIAPRISPDKTIEGFVGGILSASAIGTALWWMTPFPLAQAACVALLITLLGFAGGLLLSAIKRDLRIKDWGRAIKGHGGVLDRVDSLCLTAPALFYLAWAAA